MREHDPNPMLNTKPLLLLHFLGGIGVVALRHLQLIEEPFWYDFSPHALTVTFLLSQTVILWIALFLFKKRNEGVISATAKLKHFKSSVQLAIFIIAWIYFVVIILYNKDFIFSDLNERHSGDAGSQRMLLIFGILLQFLLSRCRIVFGRLDLTIAIVFLIILASSAYSAATASRTAAIPPIMQGFLYLSSKKRARASLMFFIGFLFLYASLASRANPSFANFHTVYWQIDFQELIRVFFSLVGFSFPGGSTMDVVLYTKYEYASNWHLLPLYLSPLPSSYLPDQTLFEMSLSYPLGIDRESFSLNFDLYTEGYYWFGFGGIFLWPIVIAGVVRVSDLVLKSHWCLRTNEIRLAANFGLFYMFAGGMVFTLRAGTRYLLMVIILAIILKLFSRVRIFRKAKSY